MALPDVFKSCNNCGGTPVITEDPTGTFGSRILLECCGGVSIGADSLEEIINDWLYYQEMEANP